VKFQKPIKRANFNKKESVLITKLNKKVIAIKRSQKIKKTEIAS
jgi:ArsR family metal-binding transcriptional regulator